MLDIEKWTPLATFGVVYVVACVSAIGALVKGDASVTVTRRMIAAVFVYWGPLSVAVPMLVWETPLVGKKPVIAVAMGALIALGIIKVSDLIAVSRRNIGLESKNEPSQPPRPTDPPQS